MSVPTLDPGVVDTAASGTDVGLTDVTGALPHDTLGVIPAPAGSQTQNLGETAQQKIDQQKALDAAALAAQRPVTTTTSLPTAGIAPWFPTGGGGAPGAGASTSAKIVAAAEKYLNVPYLWGGTGASGVDCSGLVYLAYKAAGINLPRVSYQQANSGQRVNIKSLRPGDLIAVDNSSRNPGADHIAIYIGGGRMIEAPYPGSKVRIVPVSYMGAGAYGVRMGW